MDLHFQCTRCGQCCRKTKVPLTAAEALNWLDDGNSVQIICEAWPWPADGGSDSEEKAAYLQLRSFAARSGDMAVRVAATLVANIPDRCPNLKADQSCAIYERRPLVCRIYPAEVNPFRPIQPPMKACPPEAWDPSLPPLTRGKALVSEELRRDIETWRNALGPESSIKQRVCTALELNDAAVADEGFVVHEPQGAVLRVALAQAIHAQIPSAATPWRLITHRSESVESFARRGASIRHAGELGGSSFQYLGLKPQIPPGGPPSTAR